MLVQVKKARSNEVGKPKAQYASVSSGNPNKRPSLSSTHISATPAQLFRGRGKKRKACPASRRLRDLHRARLRRYGSLRPTAASSRSPRSPGQSALRRCVPAPAAQPLPLARSTLRLPPANQLLGGHELVSFLSLYFLPHLLSLVQIWLDPLLIHLCKVLRVI